MEDKLKQQEYYGNMEELFDAVANALNSDSELALSTSNQTLRALSWQNQDLDK